METVKEKAQLQKYPAYQDSGVEWLDEIPEHWELRRFKYLFKEINERSIDGTEDLLSVSQYTGVTRKGDNIEDGDLLTNASSLEGYKKVRKGDLVTNIMLAWNGSLGFSPFEGITSPAYSIYRLQRNNEERFFHYLLRTDRYKAEFKRNSSGVIESRLRLYSDDFFRILSLLPPVEEQTAIATFLNEKCGKIDTAIAQKEKLIELLKERKQIIIQNTVTRGLNPNVKMKESGVEWIGEIPEHWEVKALKYSTTLRSEKTISKNSALPYLGLENIESWTGSLVRTNSETEGQASRFYSGDVLFGKLRPYLAKVYLADQEGICSGEILAFKANEEMLNSFLHKVLLSYRFIDLIDSSTYGAKMPRANPTFIKLQMIPIPDLDEQQEIVKYIDDQTDKTDEAIVLQQQQIEKLKEYKSSLIDAAVTGKIKVTKD